jgi:glycosyltransferase involved in cell wall biosynthesis
MILSTDAKNLKKLHQGIQRESLSVQTMHIPLKIVICPPEVHTLQRVAKGEIADATFIIQNYIIDGLRKRGHNINLVSAFYPEENVFTDNLSNLNEAEVSWSGSIWFNFLRKLVWRIQRILKIPYLSIFANLHLLDVCLQNVTGHDLVYERNTMYRFGIAMACKRLKKPYVLYVEADDILEHDIMKKPITGLLRFQAARAFQYNLNIADQVICVSEPLKAHLIKKWKVPRKKIVVFPNVADIERFKPEFRARKKTRASLGIDEVPIIIFVGNFYEWHDVATLLHSFVKVLRNHPDAHLLLVGDGAKRKAMSQLAAELGIGQSVTFTGMVSHTDVPSFMAAADIAVVPYPVLEQDVWLSPLKLFEYMATGDAIIASEVGQLSEWIRDGWNGILVTPGDVSEMAAGINWLIENPNFRQQLGQNARDEAVQKHSWDRYLTDLEDVFYSAIKRKGVH